MKRRFLAIVGIMALLSALLVSAVPAAAAPPLPNYEMMDVGVELRAEDPLTAPLDLSAPGDLPAGAEAAGAGQAVASAPSVGEIRIWVVANFYTGVYGLRYFQLRAIGTYGEIWVAMNVNFPAGDPRNPVIITDDQINYLLGQFDNVIYPKDSGFFGMPDMHDGANNTLLVPDYGIGPGYWGGTDRVAILIDNIRDNNYYDPNYRIYTGGFFSPTIERWTDRNAITIDSYDWLHRIGPNPPDDPPTYPARPYAYEGIFTHEFQHLIHSDVDADEESWINEGCADFAEFICGYAPALLTHTRDTAAFPENSLVVWGDQGDLEVLSDYGHAYFWILYLSEKFGAPFIQALVGNQDNGITGVNSTLAAYHIQKDFADLYHDWAVAMLLDSKTPGGGRYQFKSTAFKVDIGTPSAPNPEAYSMPGAPPWGTDYIWVTGGSPTDLAKLTFNGLDYSMFPSAWTSDGEVLWSGTGDLLDNWAIFPATGGGTLTFDTLWDLEDYWDFGFVQVSTDGGYTWTSLEDDQGYSTYDHDPSAHPKVLENLPGLTSYVTEWVTLTYDLSDYAGQDILIAFRLVTDWATYYGGWWIDNVYVDDVLISDGSSMAPFKDITEVVPINNDFTVTFVGIKAKRAGNEYQVLTMKLDEVTEDGLFELNAILKSSSSAAMLVTFDAPEGFTGYADYTYDFTFTNAGPKE